MANSAFLFAEDTCLKVSAALIDIPWNGALGDGWEGAALGPSWGSLYVLPSRTAALLTEEELGWLSDPSALFLSFVSFSLGESWTT